MKKTVLMLFIIALPMYLLLTNCAAIITELSVINIPSDYIIRWHLDGDLDDERGVHNLSSSGDFTYTSTDQIEGTHCLVLDGSDASIHYGDHSLANDAVTILMWLYVDASTTGIQHALTYVNNGIRYYTTANVFQAYIGTDNIASSIVFARDQWHHVVMTFDGSLDTINFYVDNTGPYTNTSTDNIDNLENEWWVGSIWGSSAFWNGKIDDIIIYERSFSDAEVRALYN